jgi:tRNA threonylcarbamoyladenosine biosynthesis protein TsaE
MINKISQSAEETVELGRELGHTLKPGDVVLLTGELGAGKTQFTKGIAAALGVRATITSPTFNLVLQYEGVCAATGEPVVLQHFDLYRLDDASQLDDIDYFGMLEQPDAISVVEWGDKFAEALPLKYKEISFKQQDANARELVYEVGAGRASC